MKKKSVVSILSIFAVLCSGAIAFALGLKRSVNYVEAGVAECAYHHGNHYEAKAPTNSEFGWQEFWACCECHHQYIGEAPSGDWTDLNSSYMTGGIDSEHVAYLPPLSSQSLLKTAVFADVQLSANESGAGYEANNGTTKHAYLTLRNNLALAKEKGADVLLLGGDIVNRAIIQYYDLFEDTLVEIYGNDESKYPEIVWAMGNHEWYDENEHSTAEAIPMFKQHARIETPNLVRQSNVTYGNSGYSLPTYYKVVNGVPFICISGEDNSGYISPAMSSEISSWLNEIEDLPYVRDGGYIYIVYHYPFSFTYTHGDGYNVKSDTLADLLADYPQAIVFSGHTHYSAVNERTINQVNFTSINIGTSSYSVMDGQSATGSEYYNMDNSGGRKEKFLDNGGYKEEYIQTILFVDSLNNHSSTIDRYFSADDVHDAVKINKTWNFPANPTKQSFEYTDDRIENTLYANSLYGANGVSWPNGSEVSFGVKNGMMTVKFPDTNNHHYVEHFKIQVTGNTAKTYDVASNYYKYSESRDNLYFFLKDLPAGDNYTVRVTAYDYFDNPSLNTLESNVNNPNECTDEIDYALSNSYSDISKRVYFGDAAANSHSSLEYYFNGVLRFTAGASLCRLILDGGKDASDYISIGSTNDVEVIVRTRVKNLTNDTLTFGLLIKNGEGTYVTNFNAVTKKTVSGGADWTLLEWNLTELFGLIGRDSISDLGLKVDSSAYDSDGYEMHFLLDDVDAIAGQEAIQYRGILRTSTDCSAIPLSKTYTRSGTLTIDYKYVDSTTDSDQPFSLYLGESISQSYGNFKFYYNKMNDNGVPNTGVTITQLDDGYMRVVFNLETIDKTSGGASGTETFSKVMFQWFGPKQGVYFEIEPQGAELPRGTAIGTGTENISINLDTPRVADGNGNFSGSLIVDYKFANPTADTGKHVALYFGDETMVINGSTWENCFGNYNFEPSKFQYNTYEGVTLVALTDGYMRMTFDLSSVVIKAGTKPTSITKVVIRCTWSSNTDTVYVDVEPTTETTPYRGVLRSSSDISNIALSKTYTRSGTLTIDYKYVDSTTDSAQPFSLYLGESISQSYGNFKFYYNKMNDNGVPNDGVTITELEDGYMHVVFDLATISKKANDASGTETFSKVMFRWFGPTQGVYIHVEPNI